MEVSPSGRASPEARSRISLGTVASSVRSRWHRQPTVGVTPEQAGDLTTGWSARLEGLPGSRSVAASLASSATAASQGCRESPLWQRKAT